MPPTELVNQIHESQISSGFIGEDTTGIWVFHKQTGLTIQNNPAHKNLTIRPCDYGADTSRLIFSNDASATIITNFLFELERIGRLIRFESNNAWFDFSKRAFEVNISSFCIVIDNNEEEGLDFLHDLILDFILDLNQILFPPTSMKEEGAKTEIRSSRYERNELNRQACIRIHGSACKVCGFDFGRTYPQIGDGYIHVHHIEQLSSLKRPRFFNPETDLIPVCPNCHAMLHSRRPPFSPQELCQIMNTTSVG